MFLDGMALEEVVAAGEKIDGKNESFFWQHW